MQAQRPQLKRTRTAKACMHCRRRRIKCTGGNPCESCTKLGRACVYECGPKKPRISHKGVITTLRAENQRLRSDLQGLRMFSGLAGVSVANCMSQAAVTPKAEELPFADAYLQFEQQGLFTIVGTERFDAVLRALRGRKSGRAPASVGIPPLSREDTALYFAMLAMGASLRRQEVPAMSYAARVRSVLAESFDVPSETMVRVALLLALLHGARLDVAREACYLSTALQMLALLQRVTGKSAPHDLIATAGAMCSVADGPLPFSTPKDLSCSDPVITLACRITQVAGALMHVGDEHSAAPVDGDDLARVCDNAAAAVADLMAGGVFVPTTHRMLLAGLQAIVYFRVDRAADATAALQRCVALAAAANPAQPAASRGPSGLSQVWVHPVTAFVLRHVVVLSTTAGIAGGNTIATHVHEAAMSWQRAAVYFRSLQAELRSFDDALRARVCAPGPRGGNPKKQQQQLQLTTAPAGGSPCLQADGSVDYAEALAPLDNEFAACLELVAQGAAAAAPQHAPVRASAVAPLDSAKKLFGYVQMVTLSFGKPFNTCSVVLSTSTATTRALVHADGSAFNPASGTDAVAADAVAADAVAADAVAADEVVADAVVADSVAADPVVADAVADDLAHLAVPSVAFCENPRPVKRQRVPAASPVGPAAMPTSVLDEVKPMRAMRAARAAAGAGLAVQLGFVADAVPPAMPMPVCATPFDAMPLLNHAADDLDALLFDLSPEDLMTHSLA